MQVFVPSSHSFSDCVRVLDNKRLFKQMLEVSQLLDAMADRPTLSGKPRTGWKNHPAYLAWKYNMPALAAYGMACVEECRNRDLKTETLGPRIAANYTQDYALPAWWGDEQVHASHRARLLTKNYDFYSQWGWPEAKWSNLTECDYQWPIWLPGSATDYRLEIRKSKQTPAQREQLSTTADHIRSVQNRHCE